MDKLVWKLLRRHISVCQLGGFFLANIFGMFIVLLGMQFYRDVLPLFAGGGSFMKQDYIVVTKKVTALGGMTGKDNTFSKEEIRELEEQPFTRKVGLFTPSLFKVSAGMGMQEAGIRLSTEMFFESVPDEFLDVNPEKWHTGDDMHVVPIIIPRNYLNLYNFGFAQSRSLPKLSEGLMGLVQMDIQLRGNGQFEAYKGTIVGFSNRLNTILVPQAFMERANRRLAPGQEPRPSRLVVEVKNPADDAIASYFHRKGYEAEGNGLDAGKTTYFLRLVTGIVLGVGLVICLLSFYVLALSVFLLLQKNGTKLKNLLLVGYSPVQVALPYQLLAAGLNLLALLLAVAGVGWIRVSYVDAISTLLPQFAAGSLLPCILSGILLFCLVALLNTLMIRRKVFGIWRNEEEN